MTMQSSLARWLAVATLAWTAAAHATIVCDDFFVDLADEHKLGILALVSLTGSASTAAKSGDRAILSFNLKTKLATLANEVRKRSGESDTTAMTLQPYVCESTAPIANRGDLNTLDDHHAIGAVWSVPGTGNNVHISILVSSYALARNLRDPSDTAIAFEYALPAGDLNTQWSDALNPERPLLAGVFSLGLGMAYLGGKRYVAAKYGLCKSRGLITQYVKNGADEASRDMLNDILVRLQKSLDEATKGMNTAGIAEPQEVHAMCAQ